MRGARRSPGFLRIRECVLLMQRRTRCLYGSGQTESLGMIRSAFPLDGPSSLGSTHGPDSPIHPLRPHNGCRRSPPYVSRARCPSRRWARFSSGGEDTADAAASGTANGLTAGRRDHALPAGGSGEAGRLSRAVERAEKKAGVVETGISVRRGADCRWFSERRRICPWYALRRSNRHLPHLSGRAAIRCEIPHRRDRSASPVLSVPAAPPDDAAGGAAVCGRLALGEFLFRFNRGARISVEKFPLYAS